jgi:hypothetical protein
MTVNNINLPGMIPVHVLGFSPGLREDPVTLLNAIDALLMCLGTRPELSNFGGIWDAAEARQYWIAHGPPTTAQLAVEPNAENTSWPPRESKPWPVFSFPYDDQEPGCEDINWPPIYMCDWQFPPLELRPGAVHPVTQSREMPEHDLQVRRALLMDQPWYPSTSSFFPVMSMEEFTQYTLA